MSGDAASRAINDARALLATFVDDGRTHVLVESGGTSIFIAREGGVANPLRAPAAPPSAVVADAATTVAVLIAPHVATVVSVLPVGHDVAAGETVATLSVLGETEALTAEKAGRLAAVISEPGALVGYGDAIIEMAVAE